jgi:hypothetical protein
VGTGHGRRSRGQVAVWIIVSLAVGLYFFYDASRDFFGYQFGTPTIATIISCSSAQRGHNSGCTATWSIDGQSHTGPIVGGFTPDKGGRFAIQHVHVSGGTAYSGPHLGIVPLLFGGFFVLLGLAWLSDVLRRRSDP